MILIGTDGGKVMLYCTQTSTVKWEKVGHLGSVISLALTEKSAVSASTVPDLCKLTITPRTKLIALLSISAL